MGSLTELPDATSPKLILTTPTEAEKRQTWTMNHAEWGGALNLEEYLEREPYLATIPLAEKGGLKYWILTEASGLPDARPVLASCESLRKKALITDPKSGEVKEVVAYGIGSVYTNPQFRGRRYASRMLRDLGSLLKLETEKIEGQAAEIAASALWSDIGKSFYAKLGWAPFPSEHICFAASAGTDSDMNSRNVTEITYSNLESFCKLDEELLRKHLAEHAKDSKPRFAFTPNSDIFRWHLYRDDFIANIVFKNSGKGESQVKGAVAGPEGRRVWALWTRNYNGDATNVAKNTLYILRLVVEDDTVPIDELTASFTAVLKKAQSEADRWQIGKIELWNTTSLANTLVEKSGLAYERHERQTDSIPSMMWYAESDGGQVEWVANEKYCWC
ncbi:hypothetical protein JX265_011398 [Neoarthrinium moseri]|uniref:LYC1 C-terminal domain-containing protein n=1 Tax=Neoarthrinium moseri TaxID=1658444 RepID=A0A9Q0AKQ7_9PEZI|nr:uncharacterized protein JN550_000918 [Neoarthrinium moseri]KAI1856757.1 hypothetical protein JX265_011398 [Neoarthrinium moseri]KAI1876846.1 hypothetical protein JN550_000918 [Neoarthrinium moseri]